MQNIKKYLSVGVLLFTTGFVCAKGTASRQGAQVPQAVAKKPVAQSTKPLKTIQQPIAEIEQPMEEAVSYEQVFSTIQGMQPLSADLSILRNIQSEVERQIRSIESIVGVNKPSQQQAPLGSSGRYVSMPSVNLGFGQSLQMPSIDLGYDIQQTKDNVIITMDVPGLNANDITVEVDAYNNVTIVGGQADVGTQVKVTRSGNAMSKTTTQSSTYTTQGGTYNLSGQNNFFKQFPLPCPVNAKKMVKKVANGVLTVTFPKR